MIRTDGSYIFYVIEHHTDNDRWEKSNFDHFGYPKGFEAHNECWQRIGIIGTFDMKIARYGLFWMADRHPGIRFRLSRIEITQMTTPIIEQRSH